MPRAFTRKEKEEIVKIVDFSGSMTRAIEDLKTVHKGNISKALIAKTYFEVTGKKLSVNKNSRYRPDFMIACMEIAEIHGRQWNKVQEVIEKDLGVKMSIATLKVWYKKTIKERGEGNQFKDVVQTLTERHAQKYVAVIDDLYKIREMSTERLMKLIPIETDIDKITRILKVVLEGIQSQGDPNTEKQSNLFTQINTYISENAKKLNFSGDIQDVTPEPEQ